MNHVKTNSYGLGKLNHILQQTKQNNLETNTTQ